MKNLSDTRGTHGGILFFHCFIRLFGVRHGCRFVWFVTFFYTLFDFRARRMITPYLEARFPGKKTFFHRWKLYTHQGQALIMIHYPRSLTTPATVWQEAIDHLDSHPGQGIIILCSHFGPWQLAMQNLPELGRKVRIMERFDLNSGVDKKIAAGEKPESIPVDGFMGGLLDALDALRNGEIVCIMGDRGGGEMPCSFFGKPFCFPTTPYYLAARAGCPLFPLFCIADIPSGELKYEYSTPIFIAEPVGRRMTDRDFIGGLQSYISVLEEMVRLHPYDFFHFKDIE